VDARATVTVVGDRYRLEHMLGEGGMARVFDAVDLRLHRRVAVKLLRPETEALPGMRTRFQQEARLAAQLNHPNIVAVLDYGEDDTSCYLVMERLPGTTLRDEIAANPLARPRFALVMTEMLTALAAAHRCGVLHRDVKPSNVLLQEDGHIKLTDFGIAKSFDARTGGDPVDDLTMTGIVLGTPGYLAPERREGRPATVQSDIYSAGAVMVESVTGRKPSTEDVGSREGLPPELHDVAARSLAPDPGTRYVSALAMLEDLTASLAGIGGGTGAAATTVPIAAATAPPRPTAEAGHTVMHPGPAAPLARPASSRRHRRLVAIAVAMAFLAALIFLLWQGGSPPSGPSTGRPAASAQPRDSEGLAIRELARSVSSAGLPGDTALASSLDATAAQKPGAGRIAAAENTLALAQVLLSGGGITYPQYQDVVSVLQATGATVPTTTVPSTAPPPGDHGKPKPHGGGPGDQG
jgi:hypothetical protein